MNHWFYEPRSRQDVVIIPTLWLMIALSILVHVAALFLLLQHLRLRDQEQEQEQATGPLQVRLAAQATPASSEPARAREIEPPRAIVRPPRASVRTRPPPVVAVPTPDAPIVPAPPPEPPPIAAPPRIPPPIAGDFGALVQAKRRERGEQEADAIDNEKAQFDRRIAANLPAPAHGVGAQTKNSGGVFQIKRMAYDDAAFEFYGWNKNMGRRTPQLIEVRKGDNSDMRIAVVRRMIAVIRQFEKEDFVWESTRRERKYVLSARLSDNAALEAFMMNEFFGDASNPQ